MSSKITINYSPNFNLPKRPKEKIKFIIIHYTGMKKDSLAINRLCDLESNVSTHYFIKKNGNILNLVPDLYEAWHAGKSSWKKFRSLNKQSIGIEIQNPGHEHGYENFSSKQISSLKRLLKKLKNIYKINPNNILGHSDIAPERKKDPGEKFPWKNLAKYKLAKWHSLNEKKLKKFRHIKLTQLEKSEFLKHLHNIGYNEIKENRLNYNGKIIIKAFQRRFRQNLINGISDQECFMISKNLLKS
tara:strand:+ start:79 stop:810 length:732 start_codon:yes stop_codon:yes gene_type:complete